MTRWYPLSPSDDTFLDTARFRFAHSVAVPAPPDQVWRTLTADDAPASWARGITEAVWTSPRPFGIGTTRTVTVGHGAASLRERFYRWDEGARMTFSVDAANRPGLRRFAEDITLRAESGATTRLVWTFALEPHPALAPLLAPVRPLLRRVTAEWTRSIAAHIPIDGTPPPGSLRKGSSR